MDEAGRNDTNQEPTEPFAGNEEEHRSSAEETGQGEPILFEEPVLGPPEEESPGTRDETADPLRPEETITPSETEAEPGPRLETPPAEVPQAPPAAGAPPATPPASDLPLVDDAAWVSTPFETGTQAQEVTRPEERAVPSEPVGERVAPTGPGVATAGHSSSGRTPPPPARNRDGCSGFLGGTLLGAVVGAILATAVVLLILYGLNGTLNFNRSQAVLALEDRTAALQRENERLRSDLDTLAATTDQLEGRTQELETLPSQIEGLRGETEAVREDLNQLGEEVDTIATELEEVQDITATFDAFLTNLRDLLIETRPLSTPTVTRTPVPTETDRPTQTPEASPTPTVSPEVSPTAATPSPEATPTAGATASPTPALGPTPSARIAPGSGAPGTLFRLTVTDLDPNTEYAVTISNPAAGFESVDLVESDAGGTLQLEYRENFSRLLEPGTYQITIRPSADSAAEPVAETEFVIREADEATPSAQLSLNIEPGELRAGERLTVTVSGAAGELPLDVALRTPAGNLATLDTRNAAADGRLVVTYSQSVTSRWTPGAWSVTVSPHPGGSDGMTATFLVSR